MSNNSPCSVVGFSVLLSVYRNDSSAYLDSALNSIFNAGEGLKFQLVVVQDGPLTGALEAVINKYRALYFDIVCIVSLPENRGLAIALNEGLKNCTYELVARMDADDICLPNRFIRQLEAMCLSPEIDALGAWVEEFDTDFNISRGVRRTPTSVEQLREFAKKRSPLSHPTVMFRKSSVLAVGGYPNFRKAQDYALWSLMLSKGMVLTNLNEVLVNMRAGDGLMHRRGYAYFKQEFKIMQFQYKIGFIGSFRFVGNVLVRLFLRSSPTAIKKIVYKIAR